MQQKNGPAFTVVSDSGNAISRTEPRQVIDPCHLDSPATGRPGSAGKAPAPSAELAGAG
jgi:hypothetical protein